MDFSNFRVSDRTLFSERFANIREQIDYSDNWTEASGMFTMAPTYYMQALEIGELVYSGTSLASERLRIESPDSDSFNVAIRLSLFAAGASVVEIRCRRTDDQNYIGLVLDYETDTLSLRQCVGGVYTVLASRSYNFQEEYNDFNLVTLGMHDENLFAMVNDYIALETISSEHLTASGFSLAVLSTDPYEEIQLFYVGVHETFAYPEDELDDADLYVLLRRNVKESIENPETRDWRSFVNARTLYFRYKDMGRNDFEWSIAGLPLKEPVTEEWFNR